MATDYWVVMNTDGNAFKVIGTPVGSAEDNALKSSSPVYNGWIALTTKPFPTQAAANAALPGLKKFELTGKGPGTVTIPPLAGGPYSGPPVDTAAQHTPGNPLSGIEAIGNFFNNLGNPNTWIRLAKVVIGGTLLIIGLAHITGAENAVANAARNIPIIPV